MKRAAVFVDGAYLDYCLRDDFKCIQIDYGVLSWRLVEGMDLLRTYYYHCLPWVSPSSPTQEDQERRIRKEGFFLALSAIPRFDVKLGKLEFRGQGQDKKPLFDQKRVDTALAVDLALLAAKGRITNAVLIAADSDLLPAVYAAKREGVSVTLVHGRQHQPHQDLWKEADERILLSHDLMNNCLRQG